MSEYVGITKIEIQRVSVVSSKPFEAVVAAIKDAVGQPDVVEFANASKRAQTFAELKSVVQRSLGKTGFMLFMELDHGAVVRKETGMDTRKIVRLVIGNQLIMKEMAKHVPDAGSYTPVTILVDERSDGVHLSYDRIASLLALYGNPDALSVARDLDSKNRDTPARVCRLTEDASLPGARNPTMPMIDFYAAAGTYLFLGELSADLPQSTAEE